jgi:cytochrome c biogenesis protein CcmG/thiol:disulfide interchange protein DsbE
MQTRMPRHHAAAAATLAVLALASTTTVTTTASATPAAADGGAAEALLRPWPAAQATPALQLVDLDGKAWDLARLRGKVVVVNFWASWCGPCVQELPVLGALAQRPAWRDRVAVVGVNYKEPLDAIRGFTAERAIPYPILRDRGGDMFKLWTAGVMPTTILVDRQGRARWRSAGEIGAGDTRLQRAIDTLLAE